MVEEITANTEPTPAAASTATAKPDAPAQDATNSTTAADTSVQPTTNRTSIGGSAHSTTSKPRSSLRRHSSALIAAVRTTFTRKNATQGASVQTLRGSSGADFEGYATVHRGDSNMGLPSLCCCFGGGNITKDGLYFLLIKGYHCFVYENEESKAPKYAIELMHLKATIQPSQVSYIPHVPHPGANHDSMYTTIFLETSLGDVEYKFTFANDANNANASKNNLASKFCNAVSVAANEANADQVRKRLGHEGLNRRRSSVKYAQAIGEAKAKDQPSAPVTAGEVLSAMPVSTAY
ncbi:hypothetical protein ACHAXH_002241 [Discostella pseudostelligera]